MCWSGVKAQAFVLLRETGFSFSLTFPPVFASFCTSFLHVIASFNQAALYLQSLSLNDSKTSETQETLLFPLRDLWRNSSGKKCKGHSSQLTPEKSNEFQRHKVMLIFPAHPQLLLQPADTRYSRASTPRRCPE